MGGGVGFYLCRLFHSYEQGTHKGAICTHLADSDADITDYSGVVGHVTTNIITVFIFCLAVKGGRITRQRGDESMRQCKSCKRVVNSPEGCTLRPIQIEGIEYLPIPFGKEAAWEKYHITPEDNCRGCGTPLGKYHHSKCVVEQCPVCGEQLASCKCTPKKRKATS